MPIYLNRKQDFSIPQDVDSDTSENDAYLTDPDMRFDRLPQPFHFINKIVTKIVNETMSHIERINRRRLVDLKRKAVQDIYECSKFEKLGNIQCMCAVPADLNHVVVGLRDGLGVVDVDSGAVIDRWDSADMDIVSIGCEMLCEQVFVLSVLDNNGSGALVALAHNKLYQLKRFAGNKDPDKASHVTAIHLDSNCAFVAVSFDQFRENEQWLELHKLNREAWIRDIAAATAGRDGHEQMATAAQPGDDSSSFPDRNVIRVTGTTVIMKMKFPDVSNSVGAGTFAQLYKQLDTSGSTIGSGLNHCLSTDYMERMNSIFNKEYSNSIETLPVTEYHVMRIANVHFSNITGSMVPDASHSEGSEKESSIIFVWWSQSQHLLVYGLNKAGQKSGNENWTKWDGLRSFSSEITACELSDNGLFLAVGLHNGIFVLMDIMTGLTRTVKPISDVAIVSLYYLNFEDDSLESESRPTWADNSKACFVIVDSNSRMYCLKYDSNILLNDSAFVLISNDANADSINRVGRATDLALSVFDRNVVNIRDMVSGINMIRLHLPENTNLTAPWKPIFGFLPKTGHLCLQVSLVQDQEAEEIQSEQKMIVVYNLGLEGLLQDIPENVSTKIQKTGSYIEYKTAEILQDRTKNHESRQRSLRECWNNLDEILKSLS